MSERWWAPTRPTIVPDAVALALMEPDGDPSGDLGASLLGLHRAGAAACEAVAKAALPSEKALSQTLSQFQSMLHDRLVGAVSKSLEESYAPLLVRDVCADADSAALDLYRACVAKGVSPPTAVSRVGAVYGVPSHDLGPYRALALDRKSNPAELSDAADRALLTYVSKLVASEVDQPKEEVSKAPGDVLEREFEPVQSVRPVQWDERAHPRGTGGQFTNAPTRLKQQTITGGVEVAKPGAVLSPTDQLRARLGLLETAPTTVVAPEQAPVVRPEPRQDARTQRLARLRRKARTRPKGKLVQTAAAAPAIGISPARLAVAVKETEIARETTGLIGKYPRVPSDGRRFGTGEYAEWIGVEAEQSLGEWPEVKTQLVFTLGPDEAFDLLAGMDGPSLGTMRFLDKTNQHPTDLPPITFRVGHMERFAVGGKAEDINQKAKPNYTIGAESILQTAAESVLYELHKNPNWESPGVVPVRGNDTQAAWEQADDLAAGDDNERTHMELLTDRKTGKKVIYWPQMQFTNKHGGEGEEDDDDYDLGEEMDRGDPTVFRFVVEAGRSHRGYEAGTGINTEHLIDPNQLYKLNALPDHYWDSDLNVRIVEYKIAPMDDQEETDHYQQFGKALATADAVTFERTHPRDQSGQFATRESRSAGQQLRERLGVGQITGHEIVPSQPATKPVLREARLNRLSRKKRAQASKPVARSFTAAQVKAQPKISAQEKLLQQISAAMNEPDIGVKAVRRSRPDLPEYADIDEFTTFSSEEIKSILGKENLGLLSQAGRSVAFDSRARLKVVETPSMVYGSARTKLIDNAAGHIMDNPNQGELVLVDDIPLKNGVQDGRRIGLLIKKAFYQNPEVNRIQVMETTTMRGDKPLKRHQLVGNSRPLPEQFLLKVPSDVDIRNDPNLVLRNLGRYQSKSVMIRNNGVIEALTPPFSSPVGLEAYDLPVTIIEVISAPVSLIGPEND